MNNFKDILKATTSFLLMFGIVIFVAAVFVRTTFLNAGFINERIESSEFYSELMEDVRFNYQNFSMITGVPESVLLNLMIDESEIKDFTRAGVQKAIAYMKYETTEFSNKIDDAQFKEHLNSYIEEYAKSRNIELDESLINQINAVGEELKESTESQLNIFNIEKVAAYPQFQRFRSFAYLLYSKTYLVFGAMVLLMGALAYLSKKRIHNAFMWIGSSFIAGSLFLIVPSIMALLFRIPRRITVSDPYINEAVRSLVTGYVNFFLAAGIIAFMFGILCFANYVMLRNKKKRKRI